MMKEERMYQAEPVVTIRTHEVALKGRNRSFFLKTLANNITQITKGLGVRRISVRGVFITLYLSENANTAEIKDRLFKVFGIQKFAFAYSIDVDMNKLEQAISTTIQINPSQSFAVRANRSQKDFNLTSSEINQHIGTYIQGIFPTVKVNLNNPDIVVNIDVLDREMLLYYSYYSGSGGLPTGTSGKVVCLLSGGIDSPVAAYHILRRGVQAIFVHFHSFPLTNGVSRDKALDLAECLTRYQFHSRLILVPFAAVQQQIISYVPAPLRVVAYRRFMVRIAERIATNEKALALATGESIGQVASQTLENIASIASVVSFPIFRPLIGMNKQDITDQAKAIGTYDISKDPDEDCCSLFVPKHPATKTSHTLLNKVESCLDIEAIISDAIQNIETREFTYP